LTLLVLGVLLGAVPGGWAADENWTRQGEILLGMGRYEEAARMFSQAIEVEGLRPEILLGRGLARLYEGKLEIADEDLTRVIEMAPQSPTAFTARGTARFKLGRYSAAIEDYTRALAVDQTFAPAYNQLGWALAVVPDAKLRNPERALEMARKAVDMDPSIHHQDTLAAALAASEKFTQAAVVQKEVLRRAIQEDQTAELEAFSARLKHYESGKPWRLETIEKTPEKTEKPTALAATSADAVKSEPAPQPAPAKPPAVPPQTVAKPEVPVKTPAVPPKPAEPPPPAPAPEAPAPTAAAPEPAPKPQPAAATPAQAQPPEASVPPLPKAEPPEAVPPPAPVPLPEPRPLPYTIQVSSYPEHLRSHGIALDLRDKGDPAFTAPTQVPGKGLLHRVFIGHFNQINQARAEAEQLKSRNFRRADIVVKPYALQLGRSDSPLELDHLETQLGRLGYLLYRLPDPDQPQMTRLLMGAYGT
jgi:Tfp pilus assembly protein PilF